MSRYIAERVLWLVPVLLFISLVTFSLMHAIEGGPWDQEKKLAPEVVANLNRRYGLDDPLWRQYTRFVGDALRGDLGVSFQRQGAPVTGILMDGFKVSAVLGVMALAVALVVGVTFGALAATNRNGAIDYVSVGLSTGGAAVPSFVICVLLIYVFGVKLHLLPVFGWGSWQQAVLPVIALAAPVAALLTRLTRASMLDVLNQDFIRTARAKGLARSTVVLRHCLRPAALPMITAAGPIAAGLVTGSFIVEQMFAVPGMGRIFVQSVTARDYGMIMGATLFYGTLIAVANLAVDVAYAFVDPRLR